MTFTISLAHAALLKANNMRDFLLKEMKIIANSDNLLEPDYSLVEVARKDVEAVKEMDKCQKQ